MAVGVVLLIPVLDKVGLGHIPPAKAILLCQRSALMICALVSVRAGGQDVVPKFAGPASIILQRCDAVCKSLIAEMVMLMIILINHALPFLGG